MSATATANTVPETPVSDDPPCPTSDNGVKERFNAENFSLPPEDAEDFTKPQGPRCPLDGALIEKRKVTKASKYQGREFWVCTAVDRWGDYEHKGWFGWVDQGDPVFEDPNTRPEKRGSSGHVTNYSFAQRQRTEAALNSLSQRLQLLLHSVNTLDGRVLVLEERLK